MPTDYPKQLTASALVLAPERRVLLVHHRKLGVWLYPGGHVEPIETPDDAAVREVREETGVEVVHLGRRDSGLNDAAADVRALHTPYLAMCEFIPDRTAPHYHVDFVYLCGTVGGTPAAGDGVTAAGFFTEQEASGLLMFPAFRVLLGRVFRDDGAWDLLGGRA